MITRLRALCTALVVTLVAYGSTASAATYTVTDVGTLAGDVSEAFAINARGDVVGDSTAAGGTQHAFLYQSRNGRLIDLDPRGANGASYAFAINDRGRVAGTVTGPGGGASHAALFVRRHIIDLGTPPGFPTAGAAGINHAGDVLIEADAVVGIPDSGQGFLLHHGHLERGAPDVRPARQARIHPVERSDHRFHVGRKRVAAVDQKVGDARSTQPRSRTLAR